MPIHGSSSIHPPPAVGPQGNTGASGAIGPMGNFGATGGTGPTGPTGTYVESSYYLNNIDDDQNLYLVLSDGTEIKIKGLGGITGEVGDAKGKNPTTGYGIFKQIDGGQTFWFKGFTAEGSLVVYGDANVLGISGDNKFEEGSTAESLADYRFLYLSTSSLNFADFGKCISWPSFKKWRFNVWENRAPPILDPFWSKFARFIV